MVTLAERFRSYAEHCEQLYAVLIRAMAADWESGGVVRSICAGWEDAPAGSFVQLRLLAGIHRLVLSGRAPELERFYPHLGGSADPLRAWPAFEAVLGAHVEELRQALDVAPQTNEPGRSAALLVGLFEAVRRSGLSKIRLLEPGASAGLNLLVDRFRIGGPGWWSGPVDSPLVLADAILGELEPVEYQIVDRRGCDLSPLDASTDEGRLHLTSFVWPHHLQRHDRLRAALEVAHAEPVAVDRAPAAQWLSGQLRSAPASDVLTVVWHSVTRLYWPAAETARVDAAIIAAGERMPVAHVAMEYPVAEAGRRAELSVSVHLPGSMRSAAVIADVQQTPGGVVVAEVADHGVPVLLNRRVAQPPMPSMPNGDRPAGA